jgi:hypothetical protein
VSEKLARNDIDNLGETRTARNRSVFRLQMQLGLAIPLGAVQLRQIGPQKGDSG